MEKHRQLIGLRRLLDGDLDAICTDLSAEFGAMSGGRLIGPHFVSLKDIPVAVLGIAFKPDTDDVRESPAFPITRKLKENGARVTAYDPVARPSEHEDLEGVNLVGSLREAVAEAKVVVLVTRWAEFSQLPDRLNELGHHSLVVDGRRVLDPASFSHYEGIGR